VRTPIKVLIVEDSEDDARLALRALRQGGFEPAHRRVQTAAELETALAGEPWDAVVSDFNMPGFTGLDALRIFRATGSDIPFILISGTVGEEIAVHAMKAGANDYIVKKNLSRLASVLERELKEAAMRADHRQAERRLRENEAQLRQAQQVAKLAHAVSRPDGSFESWSDSLPALVGIQSARLPKGTREWLALLHPDDRAMFRDSSIEAGKSRNRVDVEYRLRRGDGAWISIRHVIEPMQEPADASGRTRWFNTVQDVSEQKRAELRIRRLNRVYAVLSGINAAIVRIRDRDELLREVCQLAVSKGGFTHARVVDLDPKGKARLAASTEADSRLFQQIVDQYNSDPEQFQNLLALGLRSGKPMISNDVANDPRMPNREALTKDGTFAAAVLPILVERRVAGVVVLRAKEPGLFDDAELHLLLEVVSNLSFALEHIEKEEKVRKLTRVYAVLSGINALIVRVRDRDELFTAACRIAVEQGRFKMAWIGIIDRSTMKIVPVAAAGAEPGFLEAITEHFSRSDDLPLGNSLSARAVREKRAVISNDVQIDSRVVFRDGHLKRGSRSMALLPLKVADDVTGLLVLYSVEAGFFDEQELNLLNELAGDIAFATDHIGKRERLDHLAYYDDLTGLANRALFLDRVAQYIRGAAGGGHGLALFLMDLERFKNINDNLGRPAGDALLRQVAEWMTRSLGDASLLARVGADIFAIVLPQVRREGNISHLLEKTMSAFLEHPFHLNDAVFRVNIKLGAALFPDDGADAEALFRNAEAALKRAKARGARYLFYTQKMTEAEAGKLALENQLRQALERNEFVLHYQPKVSLESGKLTGTEALIRWNDPRTGLVPPGRFIPVLEEIGLISDVGRWALRQALADYLRWRAAGLPALRIAVNVSPLQLRHRGFIDEIRRILAADPHAAEGLELEITESLIMEDVKHSIVTLKAIRDLGVTIAIDDFGTGFSSLSYLARLPVDTLKIDRSFVNEMTVAPQGLGLVSTIISLAHSLTLRVVAEGVETEEQARLLRLLRCDEMQGFLFSKPVPVESFEAKFLAAPVTA